MNRKPLLTGMALSIIALFCLGIAQDKKVDKIDIVMEDVQFKPEEVTIKKGQTIRWTNKDNRDHIIVARDQSFKSGNLRPKETFEHKFTEAGEFEYSCAYRPRMTGKVIVTEE